MRQTGIDAGTTLTIAERRRLADLIYELGFSGACERIGATREVMARLVGGMRVRRATRIVASSEIAKLPASTVQAHSPDPSFVTERPSWLDAWVEKYLTGEQRVAFACELSRRAPSWIKR